MSTTHAPASRSTSPPTSRASTTRRCGATRRPGATSSSARSCTWPRRPSAAKFDFFFLAEGLRLREQNGEIYDLDVVGRPDTFTVLSALAAVTERLGLAGTVNSTFNEPYEVARQFATLDHLSAGRAAWNVVTSWDAFTGENFRRGGYLPQDERYSRAQHFLDAAFALFDSWAGDEVVADRATGRVPAPAGGGDVLPPRPALRHRRGVQHAAQPAGPAGDLPGRRLRRGPRVRGGHRRRDLHPARHATTPAAPSTPTSRAGWPRTGAGPSSSSCSRPRPSCSATPTRRRPRSRRRSGCSRSAGRRRSSSPSSSGTPTCPTSTPTGRRRTSTRSSARTRSPRAGPACACTSDPVATAREWRAKAEAEHLSLRELIVETTNRQTFVGSAATVAQAIDDHVQADVCDGYILVPHITPGGLDRFADEVVPLLQERGVFRTEYEGDDPARAPRARRRPAGRAAAPSRPRASGAAS